MRNACAAVAVYKKRRERFFIGLRRRQSQHTWAAGCFFSWSERRTFECAREAGSLSFISLARSPLRTRVPTVGEIRRVIWHDQLMRASFYFFRDCTPFCSGVSVLRSRRHPLMIRTMHRLLCVSANYGQRGRDKFCTNWTYSFWTLKTNGFDFCISD